MFGKWYKKASLQPVTVSEEQYHTIISIIIHDHLCRDNDTFKLSAFPVDPPIPLSSSDLILLVPLELIRHRPSRRSHARIILHISASAARTTSVPAYEGARAVSVQGVLGRGEAKATIEMERRWTIPGDGQYLYR